jgi:hypothetical protein
MKIYFDSLVGLSAKMAQNWAICHKCGLVSKVWRIRGVCVCVDIHI